MRNTRTANLMRFFLFPEDKDQDNLVSEGRINNRYFSLRGRCAVCTPHNLGVYVDKTKCLVGFRSK